MAPTKKAASMSLKATEALSVAITSLRRGRGTVLKFHHNTIENSHHWSNVKKVENKRLIGTKDISTGDLVKERVCNLTSSTSHHHRERGLCRYFSFDAGYCFMNRGCYIVNVSGSYTTH